MADWVLPWVLTGLSIWPLLQLKRWIHKHIQGLGLLITNNPQGAVLIYYLSLLPGVILHEGSQWVLAQILRVRVKKFRLWPEKQRGGVIRLGLVDIADDTDMIRATLVGIVPLVVGIAAISAIGGWKFHTEPLLDALATGDLQVMASGVGAFISAPDFWLWVYVVFAVANAMLPEQHDRTNWWLLLGVAAGLAVFLWVLDLGILVEAGLGSGVARAVSFSLVIAVCIDIATVGLISLMEAIFSRVLNRTVEYR